MQIIFNGAEVESIIEEHIKVKFPSVENAQLTVSDGDGNEIESIMILVEEDQ